MTDELAAAIATADPFGPPASAAALREAAAEAISDVIAASFAVTGDPSATADRDRLISWALAEGRAADPRPVIGAGAALAPARAALVGGFQAHLLDLDDTHEQVRGHPSAVLVPTLLALADPDTGIDAVLGAYVVGLEVMARLGRALGPGHYRAGWHPTGTAGALGAAAAGSHLLGLGAEATSVALSIAASRAGGVRAQFGTPGKPLHAGLAAQTGVEAVGWAQTGLHTASGAVTGENGVLAAFGVDPAGRDALTAGFGDPWAALDPGIWLKRYPFCSAAMSMSDAATEISAHLGTAPVERAGRIAEVVVQVRPGADAALIHTAPTTGEQARFSAEAILALALLGITPDLGRLGPRPLDPLVREVAARVHREHVPAPPPADGTRDFWARVLVRTTDGTELNAQTHRPLGAPDRPLPRSVRRDKLIAATGDPRRADRLRTLLGLAGTEGDGASDRALSARREILPGRFTVGALLAELTDPPTHTPTEGSHR